MLLQRMADNGLWNSMRELDLVRQKLNQIISSQEFGTEFPPVNVWLSETGAIVEAEIPGMEIDDLELSVLNDVLSIKGKRNPDKLKEGERYYRQERGYGDFTRNIKLPFGVDGDNVTASLENGTLQINLPRTNADRPRKITLRSE